MTNYIEFSAKIKEKYPQYKDIDDLTLAQKMVEKYPEYKEKVTFDEVKPEKKGIDLTPAGLVDKAVNTINAAIDTPVRMIKDKQSIGDAFKSGYDNAADIREQIKSINPIQSGFQDFTTDLLAYGKLPMLKGGGLGNFVGNAAIQGGVPGAVEALKRDGSPVGGAVGGTTLAAALQGLTPVAGKVVNKVLESNFIKNNLPKSLEGLTSVPAEYSERALEKELAGDSILNGKFDEKTAYIPIERKLREAKERMPDAASYGNKYYELGQKALQGMEDLQTKAGEEISEVLNKLNNKEVKNGGLQKAVDGIIKSFGEGGVYNSALEESPGIVNYINNALGKEGLTLKDLHRIKEALYQKGYAADAAREGTTANVARGVANQINNYLRKAVPEYAKPNDIYSLIVDTTRGLEGKSTIGNKLSEIGSANSAKSGLDQRLKAVDDLLPQSNKFYKDAVDTISNEKDFSNIVNTIGKQYERNPRLLANRTDEKFEQALSDLQKYSDINFMDDLNNVRAREALEKWFPGQGGGSGSSQGFGNLLRTTLIGGSPVAAITMHQPAALAGLLAVSPKFMAKGTIKNIGKLSNIAKNAVEGAYTDAINRLTQLGAKSAANLLYGGVEYNDYR